MTAEEYERLVHAAEQLGLKLATYVRLATFERLRRDNSDGAKPAIP